MRILILIMCMFLANSNAVYAAGAPKEKRQQWMQKIEEGSAKAAYDLAQDYVKQEKWIEAEQWLKHSAFLGYAPAAIELARHYDEKDIALIGNDVSPDAIKTYGLILLEYGEERNDPESLYVLGQYYRNKKEGDAQERGHDLMRRAAMSGHKKAMLEMAKDAFTCCANDVTANGISAPHTPAEGLYWLRKAAKKGSGEAWLRLAEYYMGMMGDTVNHEKAREALEQAVSYGQPTSIMYQALEVFSVSPTVENLLKAKAMLRKSAELGVEQSARYISSIDIQAEALR